MLSYPRVLLLSGDETETTKWDEILRHHAVLERVRSLIELQRSLEVDSYDALLCQWSFQAGSWNDALEQVRQRCPDLPVIILGGVGSEGEWIKVLEAGAFDLLGAPYLEDRILPALEQAVASCEARRFHRAAHFS